MKVKIHPNNKDQLLIMPETDFETQWIEDFADVKNGEASMYIKRGAETSRVVGVVVRPKRD